MTEAYKQTVGDRHYTVRFVSRQHIKDKPTEANPSPIRVILVGDIEHPQGFAFETIEHDVADWHRTIARAEVTVSERGQPDEDGNNYCRILTILGMEEEGDPVAEVQRLKDVSEKGEAEVLLQEALVKLRAPLERPDFAVNLIKRIDAYLSRRQG